MNNLARQAVIRFLASLTDQEFADLTAEARGDGYEPSASDYHAVVAELQDQSLNDKKALAAQRLRESVQRG